MKTATLPSLRVSPDLRKNIEDLLEEGESLSGFVEQSIRDEVERRRHKSEFIRRGLFARDKAKQTGRYIAASEVIDKLENKLAHAQKSKSAKP
jgi:predicted transcriptional regulator